VGDTTTNKSRITYNKVRNNSSLKQALLRVYLTTWSMNIVQLGVLYYQTSSYYWTISL